ncbi:MAG: CpsD/CapB family tyrosine-protein kinase [Erysipelotrichaceae bacterium]|nr:CpsD/CapB family tyrosine-protein kinase [Erysipelotrichaceae bacterium]
MKRITIEAPNLDYSSSEAYKALRTNLKFSGADKTVIGITSCFEDEGKSTVAMNLAISLAEDGYKTILIDADLRKSVMLNRTKARGEVQGLTHFLSKQAVLNDVVCITNIQNFHIMYSGPVVSNPAELLGDDRFSSMIEVLRESYDYIIVDTAPLGVVVDCAVIAPSCDGMMLVVESGKDSYKVVRQVVSQIEKAQCTFLGVVLNKVDMSKGGYYGGYYGRRYEAYYGKDTETK